MPLAKIAVALYKGGYEVGFIMRWGTGSPGSAIYERYGSAFIAGKNSRSHR